jgi:hypothetical protein
VDAPRPEPSRRLAPAARWLWRLEGCGVAAAGLIAATLLARAVGGWVGTAGWVAAAAVAFGAIVVVPELRWRRWRWEVGERDVEIRRGALTVTRTLVPLRRVQHVDTRQGVLARALGLADVVLHTAAGENRIPALREPEAGAIRDRIAALTRTADEL